jgi:ring-1,2-phenylacetyl-CoA epoxidase subunit PaaE
MLSSSTEPGTVDSSGAQLTAASSHFYPLRVRQVKPETRDALTLVFDVPPDLQPRFAFTQGQHLTLRASINGQEVRRSYSICAAVQDGSLRIGVKRSAGGVFSNWLVENAKPGMILEVMPPEGRFHVSLSPQHNKNYVAFAAGSGITPILSIIKSTLFAEPASTFTLFYANRASSTIMFREELAELKDVYLSRFTLVHVMTREHQDIDLLNGRIDADKAEQLLKNFCRFENLDTFFLCGPQEMVNAISSRLKQLGVNESRVKVELFTVGSTEGSTRRSPAGVNQSAQSEVTILYDGARYAITMPKQTESILDAGLRSGIDLRHSCKSGVCATCRAKLTEGKVDMDANYALEDYEIARGFILTCQSYPVTDRLTVDFDQDN